MRYLTFVLCAAITLSLTPPPAVASHGDGYAVCKYAIAANITCVIGVTDDVHWRSTSTLPAGTPLTMPWQGNTVATVASQFPVVINWEFLTEGNGVLNTQMAAFSDLELARFSHEYWVESQGQLTTLMMYAAQKLTPANLVRWRAAFGAAAVDIAVSTYAPAAVRTAYTAAIKRVPIKQSHAAYVAVG